jgi:polysaccharide pyruvyl transferase CsaB
LINNIFLIGYYGYDNAGDELLLEKSIALLKEVYPGSGLTILHRKNFFSDHQYINRFSPLSIFKAAKNSDLVVFGGGGLFQDLTSKKSFLYYYALLVLAIFFKKPVYLLAQGVTPLKSRFLTFLFKLSFKGITNFSVRDKASYYYLSDNLGFPKPKLFLAADLSYIDKQPLKYIPKKITKKINLGISFRAADISKANQNILTKFIKNHLNEKSLFFDTASGQDSSAFQELLNKKTKLKNLNLFELLTKEKKAKPKVDIFIAMRYHSLILASLLNTPFLALVYDEKVKSLAQDLGQEYIDLRADFDLAEIEDKYQNIITDYVLYQKKLLLNTNNLITRAVRLKNLWK